ncbi:MAG: ADP-forming succinate--CoA ligase subunit beta [Flavobacteriales bacterium]|jgi:succinyl-CoA synthetase beta subunit|uniref:ADP-forming succinate--CoA ligase subunit beta n=1 Tax=Blattabacterium sp. (Mastotermes darwiniensis) TaxID=39768 RepID=UPI000231DF5A|nr:ADP-forming succinate--CoA ligase subunit beta [Blattabacterium sp. (Mastotermes darwiniensis)]AER40370.1 succinyl-CoA synthetase, beta subunit [Blattabacterium sp. (Mastotermes darwiniensis) str. MADAR]MDR1804909.1 ADP-forming succinate--CoA ligase subunit beta [Flavobacteriales bacterium]
MNLHEFQGREILNSFSVKVPDGIVANTPEKAVKAAKVILERTNKKSLVIKAQIHAGGRGKGGGIQVVKSMEEVYEKSKNILGKPLITPQTSKRGKLVRKVLISENVYSCSHPTKEYYLSILLDRDLEKNVIIYSKEGGMDIEEISKKHPDKIYLEKIDPVWGIQLFQARKIGFDLGIKKYFSDFLISLYNAYLSCDALLLEINPLIHTFDNKIIAVDIKMILDDNALFRHKEYANMRDKKEEDPIEIEAIESKLNFIKLEGNVGCMVNGAGLAMATMDMIQSCGGKPSNFLDIGGDADKKRVEKAFRLILKDPSVQAVLINIFGGIVRCDTVAEGIINSYHHNHDKKIPVIIRLQGTNEIIGKKILENSQLPIFYTSTLKEASDKIKEILNCNNG